MGITQRKALDLTWDSTYSYWRCKITERARSPEHQITLFCESSRIIVAGDVFHAGWYLDFYHFRGGLDPFSKVVLVFLPKLVFLVATASIDFSIGAQEESMRFTCSNFSNFKALSLLNLLGFHKHRSLYGRFKSKLTKMVTSTGSHISLFAHKKSCVASTSHRL